MRKKHNEVRILADETSKTIDKERVAILAQPSIIKNITKSMLFHSGEPFTTSTQIAKYFGTPHNDLLKKIRAFHSFDELIKVGKISQLKRTYRGQEFPYFELDADAYAFICLSITGQKAESFKWAFIEAFKRATAEAITAKVLISANKANEKWIEAREHSKDSRKLLTNKIKEFCTYAENQRGETYALCPYYKHVTDAIYKYLEIEVPKAGKPLRDVYSGDTVEAIEQAELEVIELLEEIITQGQTRKAIKKQITDRLKHNAVGDSV